MSLMTSLGVDRLPADEQLRLVDEILDGISDSARTEAQRLELASRKTRLDAESRVRMTDEQSALTEEQKTLFQRRLSELEADPSIGLTWEQIKQHIKGRS